MAVSDPVPMEEGRACRLTDELGVNVSLAKQVTVLLLGAGLVFCGCGGRGNSSREAASPLFFPEKPNPAASELLSIQDFPATAGHRLCSWSNQDGYRFQYDPAELKVIPRKSVKGVHLIHGPVHIADFLLMDSADLYRYNTLPSDALEARLRARLFPDSLIMQAILCTVNSHEFADRDGEFQLDLPPVRMSPGPSGGGLRVVKACFCFVMRWYDRPCERKPAGPVYFVDLSCPSRKAILEIDYKFSKLAPHWIEALLDTVVASVQIAR